MSQQGSAGAAIWYSALPYFGFRELSDRHVGGLKLDIRFAAELVYLRKRWGRPLTLTSCCRSAMTNRMVSGHPRSLHLMKNPVHPTDGTMAADVYWGDWSVSDQYAFYCLAWSLGWSCGLHPEFIHIDRRVDIGLPQKTFHYDEWDERFTDLPRGQAGSPSPV